jgi:hypothetical protein
MRRLMLLSGLLLLPGLCHGEQSSAVELTIDANDSGSMFVTGASSAPTQILSNNPAALHTVLVNYSTSTIYIVGSSATAPSPLTTPATVSVSLSTGSFYLISGSSSSVTMDGASPFTGPLWAVGAPGPAPITRLRLK